MKSVFYNPKQAEEEKKAKETLNIEAQRRDEYFKRLGNDRRFRKYILEEIIDVEIRNNKDLGNSLKSLISASPEEVKSMIVAKNGALASSESIKNQIVMKF